jgi:hypothetical protein
MHQRGCKGVLHSRSHRTIGDYVTPRVIHLPRAATLAMPSKAHSPQPWGQGVGGVSERPTRATEEQSSALPECRNSERHLGSPDVGRLRGLPKEREPRPVRHVCSGARSHAVIRTGDNRCPLEQRGGERRQRAPGARTHRGTPNKRLRLIEDTSFAHSRDPCTSIVTQLHRRKPMEVARIDSVSRSGKPAQAGGTGTGAETIGRSAARRASPLHGATREGRA